MWSLGVNIDTQVWGLSAYIDEYGLSFHVCRDAGLAVMNLYLAPKVTYPPRKSLQDHWQDMGLEQNLWIC